MKRACEKSGVKLSGLSAHTPLTKPEIGVEYLKQAVRFAAECGAPVVNTDEGPKQPWTTEDEDFVLMKYTIQEAALVAEPRGETDFQLAAPAELSGAAVTVRMDCSVCGLIHCLLSA